MEFFISFDGDGRKSLGTNLAKATDAFWEAVEENEWCPVLEDEEGVVLVSWDNSDPYHSGCDVGTVIGPMVDAYWIREHEGPDRIAEEHEYKFGSWRL